MEDAYGKPSAARVAGAIVKNKVLATLATT